MRKYSKEIKDFIADNVKGTTTKDLVKLVNSKFGTVFTESMMKSYKANHNLRSGTVVGVPAGRATKLYPEKIKQFIKENHEGIGPKEMADLLNDAFDTNYTKAQMKSYYANHKISSGLTGYFPKGHIPSNKGKKGQCSHGSEKGWFKKGNRPVNHKPVGSERVDVGGYTYVKTDEPNIWKLKHKVIWEKVNGPVPKGYVLTFLDGNKQNIDLDNIELITMAESLALTRENLRSEASEYTKTGILIVKVKSESRKRAKKIKNRTRS